MGRDEEETLTARGGRGRGRGRRRRRKEGERDGKRGEFGRGRYFACVKKEEIPRLYAAYPLFD